MNSKTSFLPKSEGSTTYTRGSINTLTNLVSEDSLNAESHIFVVTLGVLIGSAIAIAIGYTLSVQWLGYSILLLIPLLMAYCLRRVYIYTLLNFKD